LVVSYFGEAGPSVPPSPACDDGPHCLQAQPREILPGSDVSTYGFCRLDERIKTKEVRPLTLWN
jgi:hypothetical protein